MYGLFFPLAKAQTLQLVGTVASGAAEPQSSTGINCQILVEC